MRLLKDVLLLDTVLEAESHSFLWKLPRSVLETKKFNSPAIKTPGSPANFWFELW